MNSVVRWWDRYHVQVEIAFAVLGILVLVVVIDPRLLMVGAVLVALVYAVWRAVNRRPAPDTRSITELRGDADAALAQPHWDDEVLGPLTHIPFRSLCAEYFRARGYHTKFLPETSSANVDIYLYKDRKAPRPLGVIKCQAGIRSMVGADRVRQLQNVMHRERIPLGICVSAGGFAEDARDSCKQGRIKLMTGQELCGLLGKLGSEQQSGIFRRMLEELNSIPTCPNCGGGMHRMDLVSQDRHHFWACNNYPECRQTLETS